MHSQLQTLYYKVMTDDIANTMRENALSQEYLIDRVREITEEHLLNEKELQIEKYIQEIAVLKSDLANAQHQIINQSQIPSQMQEKLQKEAEKQMYLE